MLGLEIWKNITGEPGRRVVAHVHFLGWAADGAQIDIAALESEMCSRHGLSNSEGASSVVIKAVQPGVENVAHLAFYMLKRPSAAKNPVPSRNTERPRLRPAQHVRGSTARLIEIFSHLEVGDVMFSIGTGKAIASRVRKGVAATMRGWRDAVEAPARDEVARHWRRIRLNNGSRDFRECVVITRESQRAELET